MNEFYILRIYSDKTESLETIFYSGKYGSSLYRIFRIHINFPYRQSCNASIFKKQYFHLRSLIENIIASNCYETVWCRFPFRSNPHGK